MQSANRTEHSAFMQRSRVKALDDNHRRRLLKVISGYDSVVVNQKRGQFVDWENARQRAAGVKDYVLARLPELLEEFESRATQNGMKVLWARDAHEALMHVDQIVQRHKVKKVVKSKSMTSEEIQLNEHLEAQGVKVWESDLGELIVQLAGEPPYHIVTPAMHKSKEEIGELFTRTLGSAPSSDPEELTLIARRHLRDAYVTADMGISGANFLLARDGAILILENEGNARLSTACPKVHLAIAGIEKVLPSMEDLDLFLPLLATSGTGQQITSYNSMFRGPRRSNEVDGPDEMYLILLDNGRSHLYSQPEFREALRCIRCGACLNACPVYKTVGGHSYNTPYSGPIGAVITPHLRGMPGWNHLAYASSLCGACTDVCPVQIPLHHLILLNRQRASRESPSFFWSNALRAWSFSMFNRCSAKLSGSVARWGYAALNAVAPKVAARFPKPAQQSFADWWRTNGK